VQCTDRREIGRREYVRVGKRLEGICPGGKTTGGNMSGVSKMTGGNMSGREFVRIPIQSRDLLPLIKQINGYEKEYCL